MGDAQGAATLPGSPRRYSRAPVPPRFSIVLVCFGEDLRALLDELGRQRAAEDEVIVVDNAAAQGGTPWVREHPQADRVIDSPGNLGYAPAVNLGAAAGSRDVLLILNPDAVPLPGCLDALRAPPPDWSAWMGVVTLPGGERVNAAGGDAHYLGFSWAARYGEPVGALPADPYPTAFLSGACLAVRMDVWNALGGYPEHYFIYHEDVDLCHRLRLFGLAYGVLPAARVSHDYSFTKGARKWRLLERNRVKTVLRTYPAPLLAVLLPALLLVEPVLLAVAVAGGWPGAKLRAWGDVVRWLPRAPGERRAIQRRAAVSAAEFARALTPRLDSPFLGRVARWEWAQVLVDAYWRAATGVLGRGR